jgi:hypothetical protein
MTTVQIIGIVVASLAVLLLVIALVVTRRRHTEPENADARPDGGGSFLDEAPQDTFSGLGKAEEPVEDVTIDPAVERATAAAGFEAVGERQPQPGGLGLDWGPDLSVKTTEPPEGSAAPASPEPAAAPAPVDDDTEITGELAAAQAAPHASASSPPAPVGESGHQVAATQPARPAEGGPAAGDVAALESGSGGRLAPLSDIIVTTSNKMVDLQDPEVRRMLTELVTFEIDQAAEFRRQGQTIYAVLQLTEAEKVSTALGMSESAQRIREMVEEIRGE